jgi:alpha-beta hydrolase superfamily lysophospholipase
MADTKVTFPSDGLTLSGTVRVPDGLKPGERRPAFIVMHGFGSNSSSTNVIEPCKMFEKLGYVTLRFDMPGCGESEGVRGHLICLEQVSAASNALTFLAKHPQVEADRIGMIGSSFGAAIAVYVCGVDKRVAVAVSSGGWGDGARKFRGQHPTPEAWTKFTDMLAEGKRHREKTGQSLMVPRYDIVPIPEHLRTHLAGNSIQMFTAETAQSMYDFRADDVIGQAAGRPILLLHSSVDSVTPTEQSIEMFKRAAQPCDLHLFAETDHFMFSESNTRVRSVIYDWLEKYFPVQARAQAA